MSYIFYNPNPRGRFVGDCVIRAVCKVTHQDWRTVHADLADLSDEMRNNMCADEVWGEYLLQRGFTRHSVRNACPYCYTVYHFCEDHPYGTHMLKTNGHVVSVAKQKYGLNFDPRTMCMNMLGTNCSTPQQALQELFNKRKISQEQFNQFSSML